MSSLRPRARRSPARSRKSSLISLLGPIAVSAGLLCGSHSLAATDTTTFNVQLIISASCVITSAGNLDFGSTGVLSSATDATSTLQVQCTDTTPYDVGLDAGTGTGASVTTRKMTSGANTINYTLYTDSGRTTIWGNTVSVDTVSATGNGSAQSYTVYGRVPAQSTPAQGTYSDTITVTVTY